MAAKALTVLMPVLMCWFAASLLLVEDLQVMASPSLLCPKKNNEELFKVDFTNLHPMISI